MSIKSTVGGAAAGLALIFGYAQSQEGMCTLGWPTPLCVLPAEVSAELGSLEPAPSQRAEAYVVEPVSNFPETAESIEAPDWVSEELDQFAVIETQESAPEIIHNPTWVERPNERQIARFYPPRAQERGETGRIELECLIDEEGRLACVVANDANPGWGFAAAARRLARRLRVAPVDDTGAPTIGRRVAVAVLFEMPTR